MDASPHQSIYHPPAGSARERVYLTYYNLSETPFTITPDPDFLFNAGSHRQAIDKIAYAIESRMGFVLLTGEVGTGKTTVCRTLLDRLEGRAETAYIINPSVSGNELLASILEDAHIPLESGASKKTLIDRLHRHLFSLDSNKTFVVIIDDAQTMPPETLEDLRLLSNLETDKHKLIQVVLSGQPELLDLLAGKELRQLKQRIAIHCRLSALSAAETDAYISQRLFVAGNQGQLRFTRKATQRVHAAAQGVPRLINTICDCALTAGYVRDSSVIDGTHVRLALDELPDLAPPPSATHRNGAGARTAMVAVFCVVAIFAIVLAVPGRILNRGPEIMEKPVADSRPLEETPLAAPPIPVMAGQPSQEGGKPAEAVEAAEPAAQEDANQPKGASLDHLATHAMPEEPAPMPAEIQLHTPYAIQLGSFGTRENARKSALRYRQKGIPAHWQPVNAAQWFRVIAGKFEDLESARQYKRLHGLQNALIIKAPLTVKVTPGEAAVPSSDLPDFLSQMGHDCLMETGLSGDKEYYTGLFASTEEASLVAEQVNTSASGRFVARVVMR